MKFTLINPNIWLFLAFCLTFLAGMVNQEIAQACHAHGGNSRDLIGCSSPSPNQRDASPNSNSFTTIIVNFVSIGSGIDRDTEQKLLSFVESEYPQVKFSKKPWGEEGEITYIFSLESLSPQARKYFLTSIQQIVEQGKSINLTIGDEKGDRSNIKSSSSSEQSPNLSTIQADLQQMLTERRWQREKTKESPYRPFFQFYSGSNQYKSLTI